MSHVFISYSKQNKEYAQLLKAELIRRGFSVWIDDVIDPSDDWWRNIRQAIRDAVAFTLVMTPESETSHYVGLELLHALEYKKPIFPLLRTGDVNLLNSDTWSRIANIQYTDVREGQLPPETFYTKLTRFQKPVEQPQQPNDGWTPQIEETGTPQPVSPQIQAELNAFMKLARQFEYELVPPTPSHPQMWGVENILPQPFEWVYIPAGNVTINNQTFSVDVFNISKYPVTNAQFEVFVQAEDGYRKSKWWDFSKRSRLWREKNQMSQSRAFPPNDHPRTNINRYEAIAFCEWLTERFNSHAPELSPVKINLPTEQQWQRAALGDGVRLFPWGDNYDSSRCNTKESGIEGTTPVNQYPKGASPYGVVDTFGNVSEWCLNIEEMSGNDIAAKLGGSWKRDIKNNNLWLPSSSYADDIGFRIVMMNS